MPFRQVKMLMSGPEEGSRHPLNLLSVISSMISWRHRKHSDSFFRCCSMRTSIQQRFSWTWLYHCNEALPDDDLVSQLPVCEFCHHSGCHRLLCHRKAKIQFWNCEKLLNSFPQKQEWSVTPLYLCWCHGWSSHPSGLWEEHMARSCPWRATTKCCPKTSYLLVL